MTLFLPAHLFTCHYCKIYLCTYYSQNPESYDNRLCAAVDSSRDRKINNCLLNHLHQHVNLVNFILNPLYLGFNSCQSDPQLIYFCCNAKLTFEKFNTLLCQVEAVLRSRPLCPLSNNPDNLQVLILSHFLLLASSS
jgi:hypothetical protein